MTERLSLAALCVSLGCFASPSWADTRSARPHPVSFHSRGFAYVAEIFPPASRQNPTDKPLAYFYKMAYPGSAWDVRPTLQWTAALVNEQMPSEALVSMDGHLVTLNEWTGAGFENAVVIYDRSGHLVKAYHLDSLLPQEDVKRVARSASSRFWNREARYYVLQDPARLYILLPWQNVLEFSLEEGNVRYGTLEMFPDLTALVARTFVNEETEVWATSLRFSSMTDVIKANAPAP